ncbi:hypothetical protein STAFG_0569 [Streptomyces afghaniensis 772]|uniref:Uncharacterized protein n=1 Tax=Streptomyces afghaniensis 772 TaxID=1283301 RepID=S4N3P6_9ACTN|nr:hypothetical protein [Streptomyces afghaniensis]EPJ42367.1 hypothetical protein STAFG_0569 [Streptomyces afghaniensis 772]
MGFPLLTVSAFTATEGQVLFARTSSFASEKPPSTPRATAAEKAATSTERSILLHIVGFVLT